MSSVSLRCCLISVDGGEDALAVAEEGQAVAGEEGLVMAPPSSSRWLAKTVWGQRTTACSAPVEPSLTVQVSPAGNSPERVTWSRVRHPHWCRSP